MVSTLPMLLCDFYKISHKDLYDTESAIIYSTWTPRKSRVAGIDRVVFFGLQAFIQKYLIDYFNDEFFNKDIEDIIYQYTRILSNTLGGGVKTDHLRALHNLGYLPIKISAVPEGTLIPIRCPMFTIENTIPEFYWITNFLETLLSAEIWKPMTSATLALQYMKIVQDWAEKTCDDEEHLDFQLHDFSMRGMSSIDTAETSGAGHLTISKGTDTIPAIQYLEKYYEADVTKEVVGCSIPATEHSIMELNSYGTEYDEYNAFKRIITQVHPAGLVSIVSDTWNLWKVLAVTLPRLKDEIKNRAGKVVIRPDSGDPCDIICGYNTKTFFDPYRGIDKPERLRTPEDGDYSDEINKGVIELLWDIFGGTVNNKGYKVLDGHIGAIYGDAITLERAEEICKRLESKGFASSNIVFGVGSYTYNMNTRDTFGFALKTTYAKQGNRELALFKDPFTDSGEKKSQRGMVSVFRQFDNTITFEDRLTIEDKQSKLSQEAWQMNERFEMLNPVFENGVLLRTQSLSQIRQRIKDEQQVISLV